MPDKVDRGSHPVDSGDIEDSRFVASSSFLEYNLVLRLKIGGLYVPGTKKGRPAGFKAILGHIDDPGGKWSQEPLVGVCRKEVHLG